MMKGEVTDEALVEIRAYAELSVLKGRSLVRVPVLLSAFPIPGLSYKVWPKAHTLVDQVLPLGLVPLSRLDPLHGVCARLPVLHSGLREPLPALVTLIGVGCMQTVCI